MLFSGLEPGETYNTSTDSRETYVLSVQSISGSGSGESAHSTG
jgi:hypothetical protein